MSTTYTISPPSTNTPDAVRANLTSYLNGQTQPMDGRPSEYQQSGLSSPYPSFQEPQSEGSSADQASAAQYTPGQDVRPSTFSSSATPTSEYGIHPSSARSGSFPEYIQRPYQQAGGQSGTAGAMAQTQSPSMNMADGQANNHHNGNNIKSDPEVPIDPSIASQSPTYPHNSQYSPYGPPHDMQQYAHPGQPMAVIHCRPFTPSFRFPARNSINDHDDDTKKLSSHGTKRTPEEFKEIRKEWKAKKKEEENQRKADEERQRQADGRSATDSGSQPGSAAGYGDMRSQMMHNSTQLPPIGYAPASGQAPPQYSAPGGTMEGTAQYGSSTLYNNNSNFPPQSPYGQPNQM
ncbi:MAG: hypothetical protein Q9157_007364 [Trypethelium eluteriae]